MSHGTVHGDPDGERIEPPGDPLQLPIPLFLSEPSPYRDATAHPGPSPYAGASPNLDSSPNRDSSPYRDREPAAPTVALPGPAPYWDEPEQQPRLYRDPAAPHRPSGYPDGVKPPQASTVVVPAMVADLDPPFGSYPSRKRPAGPATWVATVRRGQRLPLRNHLGLLLVTLGGWLLLMPALLLWRKRRREVALLWTLGIGVLAIIGVTSLTVAGRSQGPSARTAIVLPSLDTDTVDPAGTGPATPTSTSSTQATGATGARTTHPTSAQQVADPQSGPTTDPGSSSSGSRPTGTHPTSTRTTDPSTSSPTSHAPRTSTTTTSSTTTATDPPPQNGTDPRFFSCAQAKAAGYGPYRRGQDPEYWWYWDTNRDGVVCD
jgi:hypothetical protein